MVLIQQNITAFWIGTSLKGSSLRIIYLSIYLYIYISIYLFFMCFFSLVYYLHVSLHYVGRGGGYGISMGIKEIASGIFIGYKGSGISKGKEGKIS